MQTTTYSIPIIDSYLLRVHNIQEISHTRENSTPANVYPAGVQKVRHDSIVILVTFVKDAIRSVRDAGVSLDVYFR